MIFRKLDPESIVAAAQTSREWLAVCKGDPLLRKRVRRHLRRERRRIFEDDLPRRVRNPKGSQVINASFTRVRFDIANVFGNAEKRNRLPPLSTQSTRTTKFADRQRLRY